MSDQLSVEMYSEGYENDEGRNGNGCGGDGCTLVFVEANPANEGHLDNEEEDADACREDPGQLDVPMHAVVWRFMDSCHIVDVADSLVG